MPREEGAGHGRNSRHEIRVGDKEHGRGVDPRQAHRECPKEPGRGVNPRQGEEHDGVLNAAAARAAWLERELRSLHGALEQAARLSGPYWSTRFQPGDYLEDRGGFTAVDERYEQDGRGRGDRAFWQDGREGGDRAFWQDGREGGDRAFWQDGRDDGDRALRHGGRVCGDRASRHDGRGCGDRASRQDGRVCGDRVFRRDGRDCGDLPWEEARREECDEVSDTKDNMKAVNITLPVLPPQTGKESGLACGDWLVQVSQLMGDLTTGSLDWWDSLVTSVMKRYNQWLIASPLERLHLQPPDATEYNTSTARRRMDLRASVLLMAAVPQSLREELIAGRHLESGPILYRILRSYQPGGLAEKSESLQALTGEKQWSDCRSGDATNFVL